MSCKQFLLVLALWPFSSTNAMEPSESLPMQLDNLLIAIEDAAFIQQHSPEIAEHFAANALTHWDQFLLSAPLAT